MIDMDFDYLEYNPDRHGNVRLYVRRNGKRVRLREKEGTPAFAKEYVAAVEKLAPGAPAHVTAPVTHPKDTFGWLVALYFQGRGAGENQ